MFDELIKGEDDQSSVDVLNNLTMPEFINMKTDLQMKAIRKLLEVKYFELRLKGIADVEILGELMEYYKELMVSYNRSGRKEIITGIANMRDRYVEEELKKLDD